jgi:hypothetical protein
MESWLRESRCGHKIEVSITIEINEEGVEAPFLARP